MESFLKYSSRSSTRSTTSYLDLDESVEDQLQEEQVLLGELFELT